MIENSLSRAYKACFFGDDGKLHPAGRAVIADLRKRGFLFRPVHTPGDPYSTAYKDGRREVAMRVIAMLGLDKDIETLTTVTEDDFNG